MEAFKTFTEILHNIVVMAAAVVGGIWAWSRLKRERTDEAAMEMALTTVSSLVGDRHQLVFFTVQLTNKGKTKIEAKAERDKNGWVFDDGPEKLRHACSLQIRRIDPGKVIRPEALDWFEGGPWEDMLLNRGQPEINVLLEYENPKAGDRAEFWMEPGETYRLGVAVVLPAGVYVAKLTFVGADREEDSLDGFLRDLGLTSGRKPQADENFWSQVYGFTAPSLPNKS